MPQTLELVNDYFRFVTGFFEIINKSAPHIYHSALPLSPRKSKVWVLYERHAIPLVRIAHGLPDSWDPSIAATKFSSPIETAVWSPCSKFIAIAWGKFKATIEILDAVTLWRNTSLCLPSSEMGSTLWLVFSPNARLLTWFGENPGQFISWDRQTGSRVSEISPDRRGNPLSVTYSSCGTMFGALFRNDNTFTVSTYEVLPGTHIYSYSVEGHALDGIWTDGEYLRFATTESKSIITWGIGFTKTDAQTKVGSLPVPDGHHRPGNFLLHPTRSRLAFLAGGRVKVWGARDSTFLLDSADVKSPRRTSLSIGGCFFACGTSGPEFCIWKESPTGYTLHRKLMSNTGTSRPLLSPCGESIIAFGGSVIQLWRTTDPTISPSTTLTRTSQRSGKHFTLGFSPDGVLAAVTRMGDETVTVLDLKSGIPRLIISTSMKVHGLGVGESSVIVVGEEKIVTWNLPEGNQAPDPRANIDDSVRTITFDHPRFPTLAQRPTISVSPDLNRIAILEGCAEPDSCLYIYDVPAGQRLASASMGSDPSPWFADDEPQVWCVTDRGEAELWKVVGDGGSDGELEHLESATRPPDGFPWQPSRGYSVKEDRWILNPDEKRLLWLPPHWRSDGWNRMWGGRFLALLDRELPKPVIVELEELP